MALVVGLACGSPDSPSRQKTVFYASGADLQSINPLLTVHPLAKAVQKHVLLMTLARYDSELQPVPHLASWKWNSSREVLTFQLRQDVFWHDGAPTTARDVVWTLEMARHPAVAYPRARDLAAVDEVLALDSATVVLRFQDAQPDFPDVLTDLAILPEHAFAGSEPAEVRRAVYNQTPIGNGPFEFVEHRPNQRWVFKRSESFPAGLGVPSLERLVVAVVDEPTTKLAALTSGELDFAGISPAHAEFVRRDPRLRVVDYPVMHVAALVWNLRRSPFDDPLVRRALTMALDRTVIVEAYLYGFGRVAEGPVPPEHPWYVEVPVVSPDIAAAQSLLDEAGLPVRDGNRFAFDLLTVGSGDNALEQMIQAQLREVGVEVFIRQLELATFLSVAQGVERDYDALVTLIPGDLSLGHVAAMFDGTTPGPLAYPGYRSRDFDRELMTVRAAKDREDLRSAWHNMQRILARDLPTTWLYHARGLQGANRRVLSGTPDLRGELADIADWRIEQGDNR